MTEKGSNKLDVQACPKQSTDVEREMSISTAVISTDEDGVEWIQIQLNGRCLTYTDEGGSRHPGTKIQLEKCRNDDEDQLWRYNSNGKNAPEPSGDEPIFEINPKMKKDYCVTQKHHPKKGEILFVQKCKTPRKSNHRTAWWTCDA
jgi:hypothetical protein